MGRLLFLFLLALIPACTSALTGSASVIADLVFSDVNVVDVESGRLVPGQTVLIAGNRIVEVSATGHTRVASGAHVVDARGKYLIPGLWDMHVHLTDGGSTALPLFVAHGVTGVRDMGGDWKVVSGWRDRIEAGETVGPRVKTAGSIIEDARWLEAVRSIPEGRAYLERSPRMGVGTVEEARAAVDSLARLNVDFIKVRSAPPREVYFAVVAEAHRRGLHVAGHLPGGGLGFAARWKPANSALTTSTGSPANWMRSRRRTDALFARVAEQGIVYVPTLVAELKRVYSAEVVGAIVEDSLGLLDTRRRYISDSLLAFWRLQQGLDRYDTPRDWEPILARALRYLQEMHEAGVPVLAGTDFGARLIYAGWSLHDELALLVEYAGVSPVQALQAATRNVARFLGEADEFGTVANPPR